MMAMHFAAALRTRQALIGYWVTSDSPAIAERLASVGYDYICLDVQHGLLDYPGVLHGLTAVAAAGAGAAGAGTARTGAARASATRRHAESRRRVLRRAADEQHGAGAHVLLLAQHRGHPGGGVGAERLLRGLLAE